MIDIKSADLASSSDAILIDTYNSLIWKDRYCGYGDFEITVDVVDNTLKAFARERFLSIDASEHAMIVEDFRIKSEAEDGSILYVKGRSLESVLDRRIVWTPTILTGSFQNGIQKLLNENAISPTNTARKLSRLKFEASTDPVITAITIDAQCFGESLYEVIYDLCMSVGIGFKVTLSDSGDFVFKLYAGKDRSEDQIENPHVIFSPSFDNLYNSEYKESSKGLKTVSLVAGEGEGSERTVISVAFEGKAGTELDRREIYTDGGSVSRNLDGVDLTDAEYVSLLAQKGAENLSERQLTKSFEGEADTTTMFVYGEDFSMGDIVQIANEYGHSARSRVNELIYSVTKDEISTYPTFSDPLS